MKRISHDNKLLKKKEIKISITYSKIIINNIRKIILLFLASRNRIDNGNGERVKENNLTKSRKQAINESSTH